jgi:hypothetical protein
MLSMHGPIALKDSEIPKRKKEMHPGFRSSPGYMAGWAESLDEGFVECMPRVRGASGDRA